MTRVNNRPRPTIVMGCSAGGIHALKTILGGLPPDLAAAILAVIHRAPEASDYLEQSLNETSALQVRQAEDKARIVPGAVYLAPPNYHLMMEDAHTIALSVDPPVNYARPSVDVLFETAADACGAALTGIVLTGANMDGSRGLACIERRGGLALVQAPGTAEVPAMPLAAIQATRNPTILELERIAAFIAHRIGGRTAAGSDRI